MFRRGVRWMVQAIIIMCVRIMISFSSIRVALSIYWRVGKCRKRRKILSRKVRTGSREFLPQEICEIGKRVKIREILRLFTYDYWTKGHRDTFIDRFYSSKSSSYWTLTRNLNAIFLYLLEINEYKQPKNRLPVTLRLHTNFLRA